MLKYQCQFGHDLSVLMLKYQCQLWHDLSVPMLQYQCQFGHNLSVPMLYYQCQFRHHLSVPMLSYHCQSGHDLSVPIPNLCLSFKKVIHDTSHLQNKEQLLSHHNQNGVYSNWMYFGFYLTSWVNQPNYIDVVIYRLS